MCSAVQFLHHVDTTSAEPVLQSSGMRYKCPVCNKLFHTRPDLRVNTLISAMAAQFRTSVRVKEQPCVKPGDVPCDVCTGTQPKSVRSSIVRFISYCQTHLRVAKTLNMEMKKLCGAAKLKRVQQYEVDVTLDPDTAHPWLIISEDGKQVYDGGKWKTLPDNPKRFTHYPLVLSKQSFPSGRFYFEVQVKDKTEWRLGVAREAINGIPENYWMVSFYNEVLLLFNDDSAVHLPLRAELQKVGVFVDYDEGLVSFYDVEARVHIYSATGCTFSEPLYPILSPCSPSVPLILSPVNQTDSDTV